MLAKTVMIIYLAVQALMIGLKLAKVLAISWWLIAIPTYLFVLLIVFIVVILSMWKV